MSVQLSMFDPLTSLDSSSVISSPALAAGPSPSESLNGQQIDRAGLDPHHVSRFRPLGPGEANLTSATSGLNSSDSSGPADLQSCSGNKSLVQTDADGYLLKLRTCRGCAIEKPFSAFYVNSKGRVHSRCKECLTRDERKKKQANPDKQHRSFAAWRDKSRGRALVAVARWRAKQKGFPCTIDPVDIQAKIDAGTCELTGIPFNLKGGRSLEVLETPSCPRSPPK